MNLLVKVVSGLNESVKMAAVCVWSLCFLTDILTLPSLPDFSVADSMARSPAHTVWASRLAQYVCRGDTRGVESTLRAGAIVNVSSNPPIVIAAENGDVRMVECLIKNGANVDLGVAKDVFDPQGNLKRKKGTTAMFIAVRECHLDVVRVLLRAGADINLSAEDGATPLMVACMNREAPSAESAVMLREVLDAGADPTMATPAEGVTALHIAIESGSMDLLDTLLLKAPTVVNHVVDGQTPLYVAAAMGAEKALRRLLAAGAKQPMPLRTRSRCPFRKLRKRAMVTWCESSLTKGWR